jgi:hypothetical protein
LILIAGCGGSGPTAQVDAAADVSVAPQMDGPPREAAPTPDAPAPEDGGCVPTNTDAPPPVPTPAAIQFAAVAAVPAGEQLLFNDWNPSPNTLASMQPDGSGATTIFRAFRVWSVGVARAGDQLAFACGDPTQEADYGITIGDAVQHTWRYDFATQTADVLAYGNLNDECLTFAPGDTALYLCRRADFTDCNNPAYRLGRIDLPGGAFTWLTADDATDFALSPQPTPGGDALFYGRIQISTSGHQTRSIMRLPLPTGSAQTAIDQASFPLLSPDGQRLVYQNWADLQQPYVAALDGTGAVKIAARRNAGSFAFSPDGSQVAYLWDGGTCSHVEVVKVDGSEAAAPRRLRDCTQTGEFVTELAWFVRP